MYHISVETVISAAHRIEGYNGPCASLHGHNWRIKATWATDKQDSLGITFDFKQLRISLQQALSGFDHHNLNKLLDKPTAENLAKLIYQRLKKKDEHVSSVMVEETRGNKVIYCEKEEREHK